MIVKILLTFTVFLSLNSQAGVAPYFNDINKEVYLVVQGEAGDIDPVNLYNSLDVNEVDNGGVWNKTVKYFHQDLLGQPPVKALEITCDKSKYVNDYISCSVIVNQSRVSSIDYTNKSLLLGINDSYDSKIFAQNFIYEVEYRRGNIFKSEDGSLNIFVTQNRYNEVVSFTVQYLRF